MGFPLRRWVGILILLGAAGGCVSRQEYRALETTRQEDAARFGQELHLCRDDLSNLRAEFSRATEKNQWLEKERETLQETIRKQKMVADLQQKVIGELDGKRQTLETEIAEARTLLTERLKPEVDRQVITLSDLPNGLLVSVTDGTLFTSDGTALSPEGKTFLTSVSGFLDAHPDWRVQVRGHLDNAPLSRALSRRFPTHWELSTARAVLVTRFLSEKGGILPQRLGAAGFGSHRPIADITMPGAREWNRRIDLVFTLGDEDR